MFFNISNLEKLNSIRLTENIGVTASNASNTQPSNIIKNEVIKRNIGPNVLFSQKYWVLTQKKFLHFLMQPAIPCFQSHSHAALKTL